MKLTGPISHSCADGCEEDEEMEESIVSPPPEKIVVGYALTLKKTKSFMQPKLVGLARYCFGVYGHIFYKHFSFFKCLLL